MACPRQSQGIWNPDPQTPVLNEEASGAGRKEHIVQQASHQSKLQIGMIIPIVSSVNLLEEMIAAHTMMGVSLFIVVDSRPVPSNLDIQFTEKDCTLEHIFHSGEEQSSTDWANAVTAQVVEKYSGHWLINAQLGEFWVPKSGRFQDFFHRSNCPSAIRAAIHFAAPSKDGVVPHPNDAVLFEGTGRAMVLSRSGKRSYSESTNAKELSVFVFGARGKIAAKNYSEKSILKHRFSQEVTLLRLGGHIFEDLRLAAALSTGKWPFDYLDHSLKLLADEAERDADLSFGYYAQNRDKISNNQLSTVSILAAGNYQQASLLRQFGLKKSADELVDNFPYFRDLYSLLPKNYEFISLLKVRARRLFRPQIEQLEQDTAGKYVVLHLSCVDRIERAHSSITSFNGDDAYHHVIIVGCQDWKESETQLEFDYDGRVLKVPTPDCYDALHRKVFYSYLIFSLLSECPIIVKIDDDIHLSDAAQFYELLNRFKREKMDALGYIVGKLTFPFQKQGWHIGKVDNLSLNCRGYQYPLPRQYPSGGHGYILSPEAIEACASMYLAMKAFFGIESVGLEDAYVGYALSLWDLMPTCVFDSHHSQTLPGLEVKMY